MSAVRGWCPGVHAPMPSGDGLLIRVKPPGGWLDADRLRAVAAAARLGNGIVELTGRGHLQLRGMADPVGAAALLVAAGLAEADPAREARRNVIAVPPCDAALVAAIEALLMDTPGLAPKFCVAVGAGRGDVAIRNGLVIVAGRAVTAPSDVPGMLRLVARLVELADGDRLRAAPPDFLLSPPDMSLDVTNLAALPFGQTDADTLERLAGIVRLARVSPWRGFVLDPLPPADTLGAIGFITAPGDPRRAIAACIGAPGCASGSVPTRRDAAFLASLGLRDLHLSGCAKGCASPGDAVTLVGRDGRYDLVRHGRAGDAPDVVGLDIRQAAALLI